MQYIPGVPTRLNPISSTVVDERNYQFLGVCTVEADSRGLESIQTLCTSKIEKIYLLKAWLQGVIKGLRTMTCDDALVG